MIVLDENVPENQRQLLRSWRIRARQIGVDLGRQGMEDEHIVPMLRRLSRPTFFTRDKDFFARELCDTRYCIVFLSVRQSEVASFARRFLGHTSFAIARARMGTVLLVSRSGIRA